MNRRFCSLYRVQHSHSRQFLRSGIVMEHNKRPFHYWIAAMILLMNTKNSFFLQRNFAASWTTNITNPLGMCCKLRNVIDKRDECGLLCGQIELDEYFFTIELLQDKRNKLLKRGHGGQKKAKVLVMVESTSLRRSQEREIS